MLTKNNERHNFQSGPDCCTSPVYEAIRRRVGRSNDINNEACAMQKS